MEKQNKIKIAFSVDPKIKENLEEIKKIGYTNSSDMINRLLQFDIESVDIFISILKYLNDTKHYARGREGTIIIDKDLNDFFFRLHHSIPGKQNIIFEKIDLDKIYNFACSQFSDLDEEQKNKNENIQLEQQITALNILYKKHTQMLQNLEKEIEQLKKGIMN